MPSLNEMKSYLKSRPKQTVRNTRVNTSAWIRRHSQNTNTNAPPAPLIFNAPVSLPNSNNNATRFAFKPVKARPYKTRKASKTRKNRK